jgi:Plasmid stabilisation system protein.|nr:type II toxin-antitoxin system RelE/ParE family toxin [uncultured Steroidobacter sp.]
MIIKFVAQARDELTDAVAYYEGELSGLGYRFWEEVDEHISWIEKNHEVPRLRPGGYRRVNLKIFPYYISYIVRDSAIWILANAHGHTRPEYWIDRPDEIK